MSEAERNHRQWLESYCKRTNTGLNVEPTFEGVLDSSSSQLPILWFRTNWSLQIKQQKNKKRASNLFPFSLGALLFFLQVSFLLFSLQQKLLGSEDYSGSSFS